MSADRENLWSVRTYRARSYRVKVRFCAPVVISMRTERISVSSLAVNGVCIGAAAVVAWATSGGGMLRWSAMCVLVLAGSATCASFMSASSAKSGNDSSSMASSVLTGANNSLSPHSDRGCPFAAMSCAW